MKIIQREFKSTKLILLKLIGLLPVLFSLDGCSASKHSRRVQLVNNKILKCPMKVNLITLDPTRVNDYLTKDVLIQIYEGLVKYNQQNMLEPALAERWEVSDDNKIFTFYLNPKAKFHNGMEVTAQDVKWSFERACSKKINSPTADTYLNDITGVNDVINGKSKSISGIKIIDKHTVQFQLIRPKSYFPHKLAVPVAAILPKEFVPMSEISNPEEAIGTGPFRLKEFHPDQLIVLESNPHYYGVISEISKIQISIVKDPMMAITKYRAGEFHFCNVPPLEMTNIMKDPRFKKQFVTKNRAITYFVEFNPKAYKPFQDIRVRKAFAMAIDKDYMVDEIAKGLIDEATSIIPKGVPGYRKNTTGIKYNKEQAKLLLAQAGYPKPTKMPPLSIFSYRGAHGTKIITENVVIQLKKLGIPIKLKELAYDIYHQKLHEKVIPIRFGSISADYLDPSLFLTDHFTSDSPLNFCNYNNKSFDDLCAKADIRNNLEDRLKLYAKAEDKLLDEAVILPLFYLRIAYLIRQEVQGWNINLNGLIPFNKLKLKPIVTGS